MKRVVIILVPAIALLAACGDPQGGPYPSLRPMAELIAAPRVPANAADAMANPAAVQDELRMRAAAARAAAPSADSAVTDRAALRARADELRKRARALSASNIGTPCTDTASPNRNHCPAT